MSTVAVFLISASILAATQVSWPQPPFVLNCGPTTDEAAIVLAEAREQRAVDEHRLIHLPDIPFRDDAGSGHQDGEGYWHWHGSCQPSLGPQWEVDMFSSGRLAPGSYRFALPRGKYHVTIGICEGDVHATGQRVFDVEVNGQLIAEEVDPMAAAGFKEPMMLVKRVEVERDTPLTIVFRGKSERPPIVSALWITRCKPNAQKSSDKSDGPMAPTNVRAVNSYEANLVYWNRPRDFSIAGFLIERRDNRRDHFTCITPDPIQVHRWIDRNVQPGESYSYRVGAVDLDGKRRWSEPTLFVEPRVKSDSTLPVYAIQIPPQAHHDMLLDVREDHAVDGTFSFGGQHYPIQIRIRGASTRHAAKKSYRIRFLEACPFTRKVTYLKAEPMDHTMQQEKLSCDFFRAAGAWVSQADYVNLFVNDRYEGVYLDMEPIRAPFKKIHGLDPQGTLIRANTFQHLHGNQPGDLRGGQGSLDEVREFIQQINRIPRGGFEEFVREHTDWPRLRDYLVLNVLTHRSEIEANDYFYYRAPQSGRWSLIPWDHNNGNFHVRGHQNRIGEPFIHVFPQTLQQLGWRPVYWYVLPSRIFQTDALREEYLDRVDELTHALLLSGQADEMIDQNFRQLRNEYALDPHRWPFVETDPFDNSARELKQFARLHGRRILRQIAEQRNAEAATVVINEFSFGEHAGWVELHNQTDRARSLEDLYLVTKDQTGNWSLPLRYQPPLRRDEYRVIEIPHRPVKASESDGPEALERWARRLRRHGHDDRFPGFSPDGGFMGLVSRGSTQTDKERRNDDLEREIVLDFYFYAAQKPGVSYGRLGQEFAYQTPTPGEANRMVR